MKKFTAFGRGSCARAPAAASGYRRVRNAGRLPSRGPARHEAEIEGRRRRKSSGPCDTAAVGAIGDLTERPGGRTPPMITTTGPRSAIGAGGARSIRQSRGTIPMYAGRLRRRDR